MSTFEEQFIKVDNKKVVSSYINSNDYNFLVDYAKNNKFKSVSSLVHFIIIQYLNDIAEDNKKEN